MAIIQIQQPMTKREKIKYIAQVLYGLSDSNAHKSPYSLLDVAKALYLKFTTKTAWEKIPLSEHYARSTAYQYWWRKLKDSGRFQEVRNIVRR